MSVNSDAIDARVSDEAERLASADLANSIPDGTVYRLERKVFSEADASFDKSSIRILIGYLHSEGMLDAEIIPYAFKEGDGIICGIAGVPREASK